MGGKSNGPWQILSTRQVYNNTHLQVYEDMVIRPDGQPGTYAVAQLQRGVWILPVDEQGNAYLVRVFRYALGAQSLEVAAGGLEPGEPPEAGAQRELREELGITAERWSPLGRAHADTSIVKSEGHLFLARDLRFSKPEREGSESIETVKLQLSAALQKALDGEILHAGSALLILKAAEYLKQEC